MLRIALFGTGQSAERLLTTANETTGLSIVAIADNSTARQGQPWNGHTVTSPADLVAANGFDYVCIASQWHAEIAEQLIGLGVPSARIAVFDPWNSGGLVAGIDRLRELFPSAPTTAGAVPGFEGDFARLTLLRRLGFDPRVVLDVGASNGSWSATCASVFPDAHYYLVEPLPHYDDQLYAPTAAGWHRVPCAVGPENGEASITIPSSKWGAFGATMLPPTSGERSDAESLRVPVRTIDSLLDDGAIVPPQLVKLDVQGYEASVLAGGERLWSAADAFFVELSIDRYWAGASALHEMIALFAQRGFFAFDFFHEFRSDDGALVQIDCVFLRADGALARSRKLWRQLAA